MERYDYQSAVKEDVRTAIEENYAEELALFKRGELSRDDFEEKLNDELFISDSVTGNASGSYYCNAWAAEESLCHNLDLLGEAMDVFGSDYEVLKDGAEACDVTIRCYLLPMAINDVLDKYEAEAEADDEEGDDDEK